MEYDRLENLAADMYEAYCKHVGGKAHDGKPLPNWEAFRADKSKELQSGGWIAAAMIAFERIGEK